MNKAYLLLRKNQQTGPYTYEELLQQQLLATDLIWVEGKSTNWMNPSELETLHKELSATKSLGPEAINRDRQASADNKAPDATPWHLRKRSPEAELEERALVIRDRAQTATANFSLHPIPSGQTHQPKRTVYQEEESPVLVEIHTVHKKHVSLPQLIAAGVITALIATGWYNRHLLNIVRTQQSEVTQAEAPVLFQVTPPSLPKTAPVVAVGDTANSKAKDSVAPTMVVTTAAAKRIKTVNVLVKETIARATEVSAAPVAIKPSEEERKEETVTGIAAAPAKIEKEDTAEANTASTNTEITVDQPATHKKKGLGQAIKNIFKKKKKDGETEDTEKAAVD